MKNIDFKLIGKRIAYKRRELGLTQWQVEEMADITQKYLSNIERATSGLSLDVLMRLCDALEVTPDYLLLGTTNSVDDVSAAIESRVSRMSPKQQELALSMLDWILAQKLE